MFHHSGRFRVTVADAFLDLERITSNMMIATWAMCRKRDAFSGYRSTSCPIQASRADIEMTKTLAGTDPMLGSFARHAYGDEIRDGMRMPRQEMAGLGQKDHRYPFHILFETRPRAGRIDKDIFAAKNSKHRH